MASKPTRPEPGQPDVEVIPASMIAGAEPDLDARDPEMIRSVLPMFWMIATMYFRAEVRGLERVPEGPVLLVANHSGGTMSPDSIVTILSWNGYFAERPLYLLAHNMVTGVPLLGALAKKFGVLTAGLESATLAFARGASVLVYPGGDREVYRPWSKRHRIDFDGRKGFLKLAHRENVPIVPVVADGGHETIMVLSDGRKLAKLLRFDRIARVKVLPVSLALPFGLSIGGFPPHVPLPTKLRVEYLDPIDLRALFGDEPDWDVAYDYVTSKMQVALSTHAARRTLGPVR